MTETLLWLISIQNRSYIFYGVAVIWQASQIYYNAVMWASLTKCMFACWQRCILHSLRLSKDESKQRLQIWTGHSGERLVDGRWLFLDLPFLPGDRLIAIPSISLWHTFSIKDNPKSNGAKIQNVICFAVPQGDSEPLHGESVSETVPEERAGHSTPTTAKTFTWAQIKFPCWWFLWKIRI